jgi:heavy metal sensor kinase
MIIHTVRSIDPFYRHEQSLRRLVYWLLPIPILLTFLGSWWISRRSLRPVDEMIDTVRGMNIEDLKDRFPVYQKDEIGRLAGTFNVLLERLDGSFRALRRFTADASHELRGPLSAIRAQGEVALGRERSKEEYREIVGGILEELQHLEELTQSLLELARWDAGIAQPRLERIDLSAMLAGWLERLAILCADKSLHLSSDITADLFITGDVAGTERIVTNILDNAIKYTPPGGDIRVALNDNGESVILTVADTGIGIPEPERARIFERFVRLDEARHRKDGSGLGLSLVKWAVAMHGGSIHVEDNPPRGSRFVITLPKQPTGKILDIKPE